MQISPSDITWRNHTGTSKPFLVDKNEVKILRNEFLFFPLLSKKSEPPRTGICRNITSLSLHFSDKNKYIIKEQNCKPRQFEMYFALQTSVVVCHGWIQTGFEDNMYLITRKIITPHKYNSPNTQNVPRILAIARSIIKNGANTWAYNVHCDNFLVRFSLELNPRNDYTNFSWGEHHYQKQTWLKDVLVRIFFTGKS